MLPFNTPMGRLRLAEVLDSYDGPKLIVARSEVGIGYLGLWVENWASGERWLFVPVSETRRSEIRNGLRALRDAYLEAEDGFVYDVSVPREGQTHFHVVACHEIDTDALPPEDDFLEPQPSFAPSALARSAEPGELPQSRLLERLYVRAARSNQNVGQDVVASTWAAWFSCRKATMSAHGSRFSSVPSAVGAAISSFAVDLSVPNAEVNVRAIADWAQYVQGTGAGTARERLTAFGMDSSACESLLSNIVGFDVIFSVTLLWPNGSSPPCGFELTPDRARQLLRELRTTLPILSSDKIPQANSLDKVVEVVQALDADGDVDGASLGLVPRQVAYYKHAARVLGFIAPSDMLTMAGRRLVGAHGSEIDSVLRAQFEVSECGWAWAAWSNKRGLAEVKPDSAPDFLRVVAPSLSASTANRRGQMLSMWHRRLY